MKRSFWIIGIVFGMVGMISCRRSQPTVYRGLPKEFNLAYEEQYGRCYDSVPHCVVSLDLYSEGLALDENHHIQGTGYNLYLSDVILPDRTGADSLRLANGTYHSEKSGEPFTFLPGKDYDGKPYGMYLLFLEESKLQTIQVIDSGYMIVKDTTNALKDLQFTLYFKNVYGYKVTYTTRFQGELIPWPKQ